MDMIPHLIKEVKFYLDYSLSHPYKRKRMGDHHGFFV